MDTSSELNSSVASLACPMKKCQKHVSNAKKLLKHFRKSHPAKWMLMCSHCSTYVTRKIRRLDQHFQEDHPSEESSHLVCVCYSSHKLDEAMFKDWAFSVQYNCLLCSFHTDDVTDFNIHNESHFEDNCESGYASSKVTSDMVNGSRNSFKSVDSPGISDSIFSNDNSLIASSFALYPCPVCGKGFTRERSIKSHMVVHTDERAFHCTLCTYKARRKRDLDLHMDKTHHHERPYSCHLCSKTFGFQTNLKSHMLTHSEERGLECQKCNVRFKVKWSLTKHLKLKRCRKIKKTDIQEMH